MPLIKKSSERAFESNVAQELKSGKPTDQAFAIAHGVQKQARKKGMSSGGTVQAQESDELISDAPKSVAEAIRLSRVPKLEEVEALEMDLAGEFNQPEKPFMTKAEKIRARIKEINGRK
jgi:hypothetical protein